MLFPEQIRLNNGSKFIARKLGDWAEASKAKIADIPPGKPTQSALIERFNKSYREQVLNAHQFHFMDDVREITCW